MRIIIPGDPLTQLRMRFGRCGKFSKVFDPVKKEKDKIKAFLREKYGDFGFFEHPVVSFLFCMPIPASTSKKQRAMYLNRRVRQESKPDTDNLLKLYLDCMSGILFQDDNIVSIGMAIKIYHPEPKTIINIQESSRLFDAYEMKQFYERLFYEMDDLVD